MQNIVIIGASSGIGQSLAIHEMEKGNRVFGTFCNNNTSDHSLTLTHFDVLSDKQDLGFLPELIDGLVYCPGSITLKPFARLTTSEFSRDYEIQVLGAVKVIQLLIPKLKSAHDPSIVLFSTVAVQLGFAYHSLVSSSKGAVEGLTRALAAELAPKIRVNCVAPSITDTPLAAGLLNTAEKRDTNAQRHPLKKIGKASDPAGVASFLLSPQANWITGQVIHVDGGMSSLK